MYVLGHFIGCKGQKMKDERLDSVCLFQSESDHMAALRLDDPGKCYEIAVIKSNRRGEWIALF